MGMTFHSRAGCLVRLSNGNLTAKRNHATQEFNNGMVFSNEPLIDDVQFEVRIDKKVHSWSGSIEIGVTALDPNNVNFPTSATGFRENTWLMSGSSILKDGHSMIDEYGDDLDQLNEGDTVAVMRSSSGELHFYINSVDQGVAMAGIPARVFAVVDMYGKCAQVTLVTADTEDNKQIEAQTVDLMPTYPEFQRFSELSSRISRQLDCLASDGDPEFTRPDCEQLVFHEKCGSLVKLNETRRVAQRLRPLDEFNNGVVMTNRPIKDDEPFEIRLDHLVDKWSGSIEVGVTTHNPSSLEFPATMTNMRSGTIMMSGYGILINGKGTCREYGQFSLDELSEGDTIGLIRKSNGCLHYYINGADQGVACTATPTPVWGVIDLYGMAVKVAIVDHPDRLDDIDREAADILDAVAAATDDSPRVTDQLLFHENCGDNAAVINGQRTAHRPNAVDDFNNGVILTDRFLQPDELFEVRIDKMIDRWAGSIEIGVTTHSPCRLDYPSTMTNIRSGTWMMTGNGVMHNGTSILNNYGQNLDSLKVGDRVAVRVNSQGTVNFYVNGIDQGSAASNVPSEVYGVIDLYGQAAQVTICNPSDNVASVDDAESLAAPTDDLRFHAIHGVNARIQCSGRSAVRPNPSADFNGAIVLSNRPLRDNEMFEIFIDEIISRWSGSLEAGVTLIKPEDLSFPNTMTDITYDTWILSGTSVMKDGVSVRNGYKLDLDSLVLASRIGIMRSSDATLHYFLDGKDMGVACANVPSGVYAVIDLYGQCSKVTICGRSSHQDNVPTNSNAPQVLDDSTHSNVEVPHKLSQCCGSNLSIKNYRCSAVRTRGFDHGLCFSSDPLRSDELFEIVIDQVSNQWSGSLHIGLTSLAIADSTSSSILPASARDMQSKLTWIVCGSQVMRNGVVINEHYAPSFDRLEIGNRVGVKRSGDNSMHIHVNGHDLGPAVTNIPKNVFAVVDLYGMVEAISVISNVKVDAVLLPAMTVSSHEDEVDLDQDRDTAEPVAAEFHSNHGRNVQLTNGGKTASRTASYNQGVVVCAQSLSHLQRFQIRINKLNRHWSSSLMIGIIGCSPAKLGSLPVSATSWKKSCTVIQSDSIIIDGTMTKKRSMRTLDDLNVGDTLGLCINDSGHLHSYINGIDQGVVTTDPPIPCYAFIDLYGQCTEVAIVTDDDVCSATNQVSEYKEKADLEEGKKEKSSSCNVIMRDQGLNWSCEYQKLCQTFLSTLAIPAGYFDPRTDCCYCETCHKLRGGEHYQKHGEPPKEFSIPLGWCRFGLRKPVKGHSSKVYDKWHVSFHATKPQSVRRVLDTGYLTTTGQSLLTPGPDFFTHKEKPDCGDGEQVQMSPTIRYAGTICSPVTKFSDPKTHKPCSVRLSFQLRVKPGSYSVGPQSTGLGEQIDPRFSNGEVEWCSKERGSTLLTGLLIHAD